MHVTRLDLDGTGSPHGLVTKILKAEPTLSIPVPIDELARQLDIDDIADLETEGFEGGLLTDEGRSSGIILVNKAARRGRRRFTIGHELGHFLIPAHKPIGSENFLCSREDMRRWAAKEQDRYAQMEVQANQFAALILMPPPFLRLQMQRYRDPSLEQVVQIARHFDVSKEAAARAYAEYHDQEVAVVVVKDGKISRTYKKLGFPRIEPSYGQPIPRGSLFHRVKPTSGALTGVEEVAAETWLDIPYGKQAPALYEQVYPQRDGFALLMLWTEKPEEEDDKDDDRTSKERLRDRQARWRS